MASTSEKTDPVAEVRRRVAEARRHRLEQPDRTHDRLMVAIWFVIYGLLFGALVFMAAN